MTAPDADSETYPYGRQGNPNCYYRERTSLAQLKKSGQFADNAVKFLDSKRIVVLYEAPTDDDPARGHYSVWTARGNEQMYEQVSEYSITGDDGMCYDTFTETSLASLDL